MNKYMVWEGNEDWASEYTATDAEDAVVEYMKDCDENGVYYDGYPDGAKILVKDEAGNIIQYSGSADFSVNFYVSKVA